MLIVRQPGTTAPLPALRVRTLQRSTPASAVRQPPPKPLGPNMISRLASKTAKPTSKTSMMTTTATIATANPCGARRAASIASIPRSAATNRTRGTATYALEGWSLYASAVTQTIATSGASITHTSRLLTAKPPDYGMCNPLMLRATTRRWISEVPSKIV